MKLTGLFVLFFISAVHMAVAPETTAGVGPDISFSKKGEEEDDGRILGVAGESAPPATLALCLDCI